MPFALANSSTIVLASSTPLLLADRCSPSCWHASVALPNLLILAPSQRVTARRLIAYVFPQHITLAIKHSSSVKNDVCKRVCRENYDNAPVFAE
jgi:hypothetical protein